ncbi:unnamed protein product [Rhizophagus irregularis]|nr:unnamed protein product [Rhizophagus irregularis]
MAGVSSIRWTSYTIKFDKEYQNDQSKEYLLVTEYANGIVYHNLHPGYRETIVLDTFAYYSNIYTECWSNEPDNRPTLMENVVIKIMICLLKYLNY